MCWNLRPTLNQRDSAAAIKVRMRNRYCARERTAVFRRSDATAAVLCRVAEVAARRWLAQHRLRRQALSGPAVHHIGQALPRRVAVRNSGPGCFWKQHPIQPRLPLVLVHYLEAHHLLRIAGTNSAQSVLAGVLATDVEDGSLVLGVLRFLQVDRLGFDHEDRRNPSPPPSWSSRSVTMKAA